MLFLVQAPCMLPALVAVVLSVSVDCVVISSCQPCLCSNSYVTIGHFGTLLEMTCSCRVMHACLHACTGSSGYRPTGSGEPRSISWHWRAALRCMQLAGGILEHAQHRLRIILVYTTCFTSTPGASVDWQVTVGLTPAAMKIHILHALG